MVNLKKWVLFVYIHTLKVPKCEIFDLMDSRDFYSIKPLWACDFGNVIKNSKLFRFGLDFEVFSAKILS